MKTPAKLSTVQKKKKQNQTSQTFLFGKCIKNTVHCYSELELKEW